ncbi:MAG: glycosyltransferase family 61 protein [Shimia thalassica]|uniref:glycosyltransferase family 61 protein n=1 Tax=Shimia thalassica TaxID=1715693 RepID=UPI0032968A4A
MSETTPEFAAPRLQGPFEGTLLTGGNKTRFLREFGIYGVDGVALPDSDIGGQELSSFPAENPDIPTDIPEFEGPALFAGLVLEQFGHVLMNSLGRLWALDKLPPDVTLVFVPKRRPAARNYPFLRMILDMFGISNDFIITKGPMHFKTLYTASDLFGERYLGRGSVPFFDWLDQRLPAAGPVTKGRKVYLTRTGLGDKIGRFACEDHLEKQLAAQGYEIIAPEKLGLLPQIALYQDAEHLIFSESSALHLYGMVRRPGQTAAVIKRREELPVLIRTQMNDRAGTDVAEIHALRRIFWPPLRSDHLSISLLDFKKVHDQLAAANLIDPDTPWQAPSFDAEKKSMVAGLEPGEKLLNRQERRDWLRALRKARDGKAW